MTHRADAEFTADDGTGPSGWVFLPDGPGPRPAITMAHGCAGTREHGHEPAARTSRVSPAPLLTIVAPDDVITVTDLALAAYERAPEPKELRLIPGGHLDPYPGQFAGPGSAALSWFREHLA